MPAHARRLTALRPALATVGVAAGGWAALQSTTPRTAAFRGATTGSAAVCLVALVLAVGWHAARLRAERAA